MKKLAFLVAVGLGAFIGSKLLGGKHRSSGLININEASQDQIMKALNLDSETAERIVEHRPYPSKIDLLGRMVVPEEIYVTIRERITHKTA